MRIAAFALLFIACTSAPAQWEIEESHTTASLRGIHNVGGGVAWASGTNGTVLRTTDDGKTWQTCPIPLAGTKDSAEKLDFRGIQAFDENTAIMMSSGPGDQSRLYKTTDGCQTWKLLFTNPDKDGFWDALSIPWPSSAWSGSKKDPSHAHGFLLGDPVNGVFTLFITDDGGNTWSRVVASKRAPKGEGCKVDTFSARDKEAVFAASNESMLALPSGYLIFVTGGSVARMAHDDSFSLDGAFCHESAHFSALPIAHGNDSSGAFAFATYPRFPDGANFPNKIMIVGGDYKHPDSTAHNAVFGSGEIGAFWQTFQEPKTPPHGYRSAVAYDADTKTWITVGPNGTDISTDDGRNWRPLTPTPQDAPDADKNWNALSLPFVVGPKGRIGKLRPTALPPATQAPRKSASSK